MRHPIFHILLIAILLTMAFPFHSSGSEKEIDFNFPQDVSKTALADLDKALKSGDGQMTVDALVRYSIAQSGISQDNMPDIVERIEKVIAKEKQPHIKSLLYYFEALVYKGYRDRFARWRDRNNPVGEEPTDVSEWDREQFDRKILSLSQQSMTDREALKQVAVTSLPGIIRCNKLGATYVPTLNEFMLMKNIELVADGIDDVGPMVSTMRDQWLEDTRDNAPAHIYALSVTGNYLSKEEFEKYLDSEYCALLLNRTSFDNDKDNYKVLQDYVKRFPNSMFTPQVKNKITELERKEAQIRFPEICTSSDSITVNIKSRNTNSFTINIYRLPDGISYEEAYGTKVSTLKLERQHTVKVQGFVPFNEETKVTLPPLPYGMYVMDAANLDGQTAAATSSQVVNYYNLLRVTDISLMTVSHLDGNDRVCAVNSKTGKPLPGVNITYFMGPARNSVKGPVGTTDSNGMVYLPETFVYKGENRPFNGILLFASKGDDKSALPINYGQMRDNHWEGTYGEIYTDLGVYRPGETVQWAATVMAIADYNRAPAGNAETEVIFSDQNREPIDTVTARTDEFGRIEGSFVVPKDRMNGRFLITMKSTFGGRDHTAYKTVNVSEYKTPTFEVTFPDARHSYVAGQSVKVTGKAETYSGMPVANATVRLSLVQKRWSWWWWRNADSSGEHLLDTTVVTDGQGMFSFSYDPELFSENRAGNSRHWACYNYVVAATITTDAGETQEASTSFIVGTRRGIELGSVNKDTYLNDKPIKLPLKYNTTDEKNTSTWCTWEVIPEGGQEAAKTGNLNTDDPTIDLTDLPSGKYRLKIHIIDAEPGEEEVDVERDITIYRKKDKVPPVKDNPMWISPLEQNVDKNNVGHITIGVSTPKAYIYYVASTADKVIGEGWLNYDKGLHDFSVRLPKEAGADVVVQFITFYDNKSRSEAVKLINPYEPEALKITATSFRDKLTPGDTEHWTFTLTDQNGKPLRGAMLLDMYDKAIESITGNKWTFNNSRNTRTAANVNTRQGGMTGTAAYWMGKQLAIPESTIAELPYLYLYNQQLFGMAMRYDRGERVLYKSEAAGAPMNEEAEFATSDAMLSEVVVTGYGNEKATKSLAVADVSRGFGSAEVNEKNLDKVALRENDVKTALWLPMLTSDDNGVINLEFEVPNFNTTWITQAMAWDKKMHGDTWMADVLTQKPLMVKSNMPRFLRQGDKARLAAMVQNATDEAATCDAVIELFDPRTGDVYATNKFNLQLDPKGSQAVNIDWIVPDTIAFVGFRIKAANGRYGDGEQVMVPVLTTISPVIETEPFYIEAAQGHYEQPLPDFPADARVTLEYCDNPIWYCVLALPTIFSDEYHIATQAAHSLFALQVAQGVAKDQPQIKEAVTYWKEHEEDSTLVSMLQKNQDLKIGTLLASPWMRDADRQTLRMSKLNELFDEAIAQKEYEKIISSLQSLQMSDGGFTWFLYPQCESSYWTTGTVLELLGDIKRLGYLPDDSRLTEMINRALNYYDNESVRLLNEYKKYDKNPYDNFTSYAYIRSFYPEVKQSKASADLKAKTLKYMDKNWNKGITLNEKGFYAMTLYRNGYKKTAASIIESIRQFAIVKPNLGMYWDNLQTGYGWWELDKVAYTCTILRAMSEVDPRQQEIDQVRKWMLLMKQSNDWGSYSLAADAVHSILSTGSQWLDRGTTPTITVAGQPVNLDKMAQWLGYFRTTLDATTTGSVVIDRTSKGPAWGAIYSQFKAPMTQIKEKAIDEVSISKEYYVYAQDGTLHQATSFNVGDKVKVRVIIKLNKDMDYVTMTDERAACFEPVDQLSGYRSEDRTWFYLETKDNQTNAFFNRLDKGTHIIGYDVWVTNPGEFTSGIATIQCQYAPQLSAHSAGKMITVQAK